MKVALDIRKRSGPYTSYVRVTELLEEAASAVGLDFQLWDGGPIHADVLWHPELVPAAVETSVPRVISLHDVSPLLRDARSALVRWRRGRRFRRQFAIAARQAAAFAAGSNSTVQRVAAAFPNLQTPLKVVPIYPAVTLQAASAASCQEVLGEFGIEGAFVLFVAAMRKHKNWQGALLGWANLPEELRQQHPLVLAGPNHRALPRMRRMMERLGVADQVYLTGNLNDRQLAALYTSCKLFLFPSYNEGFGLPPLEAMKCGAPVIAADAPAMPEVLGSAAAYVDPFRIETITAQLQRVLTDTQLEQRLRAAGKATRPAGCRRPDQSATPRLSLSKLLAPRRARTVMD